MTVLQLLAGGAWPVRADDPVLAPEDLLAVQQASTLARQCEQRSDEILQAARARMQQEVDAGFRRGMQDGTARCAARLLEYEQAQQAEWQRREQDTMALVMLVLERLGPALAQGDLIRTLVRQAVGEARQARRLLIKVHPDHVHAVEEECKPLRVQCAWLETLEVMGVPELAPDDCVLESPNGFINAGWATQLAAIRQVLGGMATTP
jgi:flagellar biosynthesis/type III secretory pathway protein FliH